eukprot:scaffold3031_cov102-Cylindrotheca_fusiformis.AAC.7
MLGCNMITSVSDRRRHNPALPPEVEPNFFLCDAPTTSNGPFVCRNHIPEGATHQVLFGQSGEYLASAVLSMRLKFGARLCQWS